MSNPAICKKCRKTDTNMQLCGKCNNVYYCSRQCQTANWSAHKLECYDSTTVAYAEDLLNKSCNNVIIQSHVNALHQLTKPEHLVIVIVNSVSKEAVIFIGTMSDDQHKEVITEKEFPENTKIMMIGIPEYNVGAYTCVRFMTTEDTVIKKGCVTKIYNKHKNKPLPTKENPLIIKF